MNEATKAMYAKILEATKAKEEAKTAQKTTVKAIPAPAVEMPAKATPTPPAAPQPKPVFKPEVKDIFPEMSNITFADLLPQVQTPAQEAKQEVKPEATPAATASDPDKKVIGEFTFLRYSDKSFAVLGPTTPHRFKMREFDGSFNYHLKCGQGWIFANKKYYIVKSYFERLTA